MIGRTMVRVSPYEARWLIQEWEPPEHPHCSNCRHAKIGGTPDEPTTACTKGHGRPMTLWPLIRHKHARQFIPAIRCPDFEEMGPACNVDGRRTP